MTQTPFLTPDTVPVRHTPAPALPPRDAVDGADARLLAGLASATSLAGAASATWIALRAFARHNRARATDRTTGRTSGGTSGGTTTRAVNGTQLPRA
ncbi:hypothetical protein [Streptomyces sp. NPDC020298]|uniref:hypothetical protein n=1 Tax=unclassified Streptomyces TaxID=2593676 RepID=UPI0033FC84FD